MSTHRRVRSSARRTEAPLLRSRAPGDLVRVLGPIWLRLLQMPIQGELQPIRSRWAVPRRGDLERRIASAFTRIREGR